MANKRLPVFFLSGAKTYADSMTDSDRGTLARDIEALADAEIDSIRVKILARPVFELIVGYHRFTYFELDACLYIMRGFRKKSAKTPKKEIEYAQKMYKLLNKKHEK